MKRPFRAAIITALLISGGILFGQDFRLIYSDGMVEISDSSGWTELSLGDAVSGDRHIRIGTGAVAEFSGPSGTLSLSRPGTYLLSAAGKDTGKISPELISLFSRILTNIRKDEGRRSQVMGVRSESMGTVSTFVDEDSLRYENALSAFSRGEYSAALAILEEGAQPDAIEDGGRLRLYALVKGILLSDGGDFPGAVEQFGFFLKFAETDADRQTGFFLLGYTLLLQGEKEKAAAAFSEAVSIGADPEITRLARERLR